MLFFAKKTASTLLLLLSVRGTGAFDKIDEESVSTPARSNGALRASKCESARDATACAAAAENGEACAWCEAGAVPSACYKASDAARLPPGVFVCETTAEEEAPFALAEFSFVPGRTHSIGDAPVDPAFCDPSSPRSFSGYMSVTGSAYDAEQEDKNLFFWFFEKRGESTEDVPLVVWLTGGPGCSSMLALFFENGPCNVNERGDGTRVNPYGWNEAAHVLWLDQPAGVGFSYGAERDYDEDMIGEDAYYFLQSFYRTHPEYSKNPLFVVGESYGGHYSPAIAHRILIGNREDKPGTQFINLKGMGVGNGLTNPAVQYEHYANMTTINSHQIHTVSDKTYQSMLSHTPTCVQKIRQCNNAKGHPGERFLCQAAMAYCNAHLVTPYAKTGLNVYDIRQPCLNPPLCYDFANIERFLRLQSTRETLNVVDRSDDWVACSSSVQVNMLGDYMNDLSPDVAELLDAGVRVLIYAGDCDFICNYMGNRAWTLELEWSGKSDFNDAEEREWNEGAGLARSAKGLTFLQVRDAGHMVPYDQPAVSLDLITDFVNGNDF